MTATNTLDFVLSFFKVEEYFQDFDPLRSGSISKSHFRRGLSSLGQHQLTDAQFEVMVLHYSDPKRAGNVIWTQFLKDIEQGNLLNIKHAKAIISLVNQIVQPEMFSTLKPSLVWLFHVS